MKKIKLLLFALIAFAGIHANAQTVDEIVNKYVNALGGKEKLASLKTVRMTGNLSMQGTDIAMVITKSHMIGMRTDIEFNGNSYYQFANATKGQMFMPPMTDAEEMDEETFKSFANQMDVQGGLFNYKEKGSTVELVGTEKVSGADAYNLKVTFKNGKVSNYYIDKTTNRLVKSSGKATMQGNEMTVETSFSDYKQNTDGFWFAYTITGLRGPITFNKIETNIPVDEKMFSN
ncbi:MAG: hypothetical protein ABI402_10835 [Ferruginibacter sp.]